jgi:hypothetical protein
MPVGADASVEAVVDAVVATNAVVADVSASAVDAAAVVVVVAASY